MASAGELMSVNFTQHLSGTPVLLMRTEDDRATMLVRQFCEIKQTVTNQCQAMKTYRWLFRVVLLQIPMN